MNALVNLYLNVTRVAELLVFHLLVCLSWMILLKCIIFRSFQKFWWVKVQLAAVC